MSIVYICEKPSQARDIAKILSATKKQENFIEGNNTIVTWCFGHLLEMASPDSYQANLKPWRLEKLPIIPNKWQMQIVDKSKKQFNTIKKLLKTTQHVVIATDSDREGEVIAREILELCEYKGKIQRLWLSALDDLSIKKALANLKEGKETEYLYYAGLGRQRADWLIGMNMTMAASCLFSKYGEGVLSVGRVQTPTLKIIVDRDHEIENFRSKDYYVLLAQFLTNQNESFWTKWEVPDTLADESGRCLNKVSVEVIAKKISGKMSHIKSYKETEKEQTPPLCLSLSALQKIASSRYGMTAKQTLDVAQALYEKHKATTYPRTDCSYLPENQFKDAQIILNGLSKIDNKFKELIVNCDVKLKSPVWNDKKMTAHHAIIPTLNTKVDIKQFSSDEYKLYELICRYYSAQFLGNFTYVNRSVTVVCEQEQFKASCNTPIKLGWKQALQAVTEKEEGLETDNVLSLIPTLKLDETVLQTNYRVETKQTQPPARFTEGTLIEAMKSVGKYVENAELKKILKVTAGIGTEATRASILETLIKRDYIKRQGKQVISTEKGRSLIHCLPALVTDPATTAQWEQALEQISAGYLSLDIFLTQQVKVLETMLIAIAAKKQPV